jgi:hypothetical protein
LALLYWQISSTLLQRSLHFRKTQSKPKWYLILYLAYGNYAEDAERDKPSSFNPHASFDLPVLSLKGGILQNPKIELQFC